jgi:hypothetical protein
MQIFSLDKCAACARSLLLLSTSKRKSIFHIKLQFFLTDLFEGKHFKYFCLGSVCLFVCAGVTRQGMVLIFHTVEDDILGIKKTEK